MTKQFGVAVKAIIKKGDKYLIIKKSDLEDVNPNTYDIPGGRVEFGEQIDDALLREVKEEVNLDIKKIKPTNVWSFQPREDFQLVGITFLCEYVSGDVNLSHEHSSYEWLTKEEVLNGNFPSWMKKEFSLI